MESSAASVTNGVLLPNYPLASGFLLRAIEHSGSVLPTSTDDAGEYYAMALAKVVQAEEVPANSIMVIPLTTPRALLEGSLIFRLHLCGCVRLHVCETA